MCLCPIAVLHEQWMHLGMLRYTHIRGNKVILTVHEKRNATTFRCQTFPFHVGAASTTEPRIITCVPAKLSQFGIPCFEVGMYGIPSGPPGRSANLARVAMCVRSVAIRRSILILVLLPDMSVSGNARRPQLSLYARERIRHLLSGGLNSSQVVEALKEG